MWPKESKLDLQIFFHITMILLKTIVIVIGIIKICEKVL